ncbi:hypothetical protein ACJX0J_033679, partial [Zea mays]
NNVHNNNKKCSFLQWGNNNGHYNGDKSCLRIHSYMHIAMGNTFIFNSHMQLVQMISNTFFTYNGD